MARTFEMEDGGRVLVLSSEEGLIEHMARGECVIGVMSDVAPPALMTGCYLVEDEEHVDPDFVKKVYARFRHEPWIIGTGEHVLLRELVSGDYDALLSLEREYYEESQAGLSDVEVSSVLGFSDPMTYSEEEGRDRLRTYIDQQYSFYEIGLWAVIEEKTGRLVGVCGFSDTDNYGFTLGYHIAKAYRGQHYAKESCELAIAFGVLWQEIPEVVCLIQPQNLASIRVAESLLMEVKGEYDGRLLYQKTTISEKEPLPLTRKMVRWFEKVAGRYFKKK